MKKNLPSSLQNFKANTFLKSVLLLAAILFSTLASNATTDTIPATLVSPAKFGGCIDTVFTISYSNTGANKHAHQLRIAASLINSSMICAGDTSIGIPLIMIADSSSTNAPYATTSLTGDTLIYSVDSSSNDVIIKFKVHIDCANIDLLGSSSIPLQLKIEDVSNAYYLNINGSGNNSSLTDVLALKLIPNNASPFSFYYHTNDTSYIQFTYFNISLFDAHIRFSFNVYDSTLCNSGETKYFMYAIDTNSFTIFTANTPTSIFLPQGKNLYIRQFATQKKCLPSLTSCLDSVYLTYQCDFPESSFCTSCLDTNIVKYGIISDDNPSLLMTDLTPILIDSDYTCFNDSIERSYRFVYKPSTLGIVDSIHIHIENYGQPAILAPTMLSLISNESISINCLTCSIVTFITPNNVALCSTYVPNPIRKFAATVTNFLRGDTLTLKFKTFRCAEDNDSELLNKPKSLNQWQVWHTDYRICKDTGQVLNLSSESTGANGGANINQILEFYPTTNNLSVPHDSLFGDTLKLTVDLKRMTTNNYENFQYLGCNYLPGCHPNGLIRARIFVDSGLHVSNYSSAYFQVDTGITPNIATYIITPNYYNSSIPDTVCEAGYYYFYYRLTDTLFNAMQNGKFNYTVRACCADSGNAEPCKVGVSFYIMPDPNNCFTESFPSDNISPPVISNTNGVGAFIPLSSSNFQMHIHCPGCKAPGVIADSYKIKRISYGLQDSNNNSIADNGLIQITDTSAWFISNKNNLALNHSSFGDKLQDFLIAHFQDGDDQDPMMPGYKYSQMKNDSAFVRYLQIAAVIPEYKKHGLKPYSLDFYIDDTMSTGSADTCIDCALFGTTTNHRTLLHISIPDSLISNYLKIDTATGTYFTTFSMLDTSAFYVLDASKVNLLYQSLSLPFDSFEVDQRYRLTIKYNECNNFTTPVNSTTSDVIKPTEITLQTWLSGTYKPFNSFGQFKMPNTIAALHVEDWQFSNETDTFRYVNQNFANYFQFYCEANGTLHYFFSQDISMSTLLLNIDKSCRLRMFAQIGSSIARAKVNVYPYEYRPPTLFPSSYWFKIPVGYTLDSIMFGIATATQEIKVTTPAISLDGFYHIPYMSLPIPACRPENTTAYPYLQYLNSGANAMNLTIYIAPLSCMDSAIANLDTMLFAYIDTLGLDCMHLTDCPMNDTIHCSTFYAKAMSFANLQVNYSPLSPLLARTHNLCWQVTFTNPSIFHGINTANNSIFTINAPHVYLQLPDTSFLNNFTFTPSGSTMPIAAVNGIINVAENLEADKTITGMLCADYVNCVNVGVFPVTAGYDCFAFPTAPFNDSTVCFALHNNLLFENDSADLFDGISPQQINYTLCTPLMVPISYSSAQLGVVYPDSIVFNNVQGVTVQNVQVKNCLDTASLSLATTGINNHWLVTQSQLDSLSFNGGGISVTQPYDSSKCVEFIFTLNFDCDFKQSNLNDVIKFFGHNYCNEAIEKPTSLINFIIDTAITCPDCYSITKTVDKDTAMVGDTLTYIITTCGNNSSPQSIIIYDIIPPNFTIITPTPTLPNYTAIGTGCITDTLRGFFTVAGSCPATINTAHVDTNSNGEGLTTTVCNTILSRCYRAGYLVINDSTFSSSLPFGTYTNDTLIINGRFYIDNYFTLLNCYVITEPGANIIVINNNTLNIYSTIIEACSNMWRGIYLEESGDIEAIGSRIFDAENGIWARQSNTVVIANCLIANCITGIRMQKPNNDSLSIYSYVSGSITGTEIGKISSLKSPYNGQPYYGTFPFACVFMQNVIYNIGSTSYNMNNFHDANNGVVAVNTVSTISNTKFKKINVTDTFPDYNINAAVAAQGANSTALCDVKVHPLYNPALTTIDSCYLSVNSKKSNIEVNAIRIKNTNLGVSVNQCNNLLKAQISSNYIEAKTRGIVFNNNNGSLHCTAEENQIYISNEKSKGIAVNESNTSQEGHYYVVNNNVYMDKGVEGILLMNVDSAMVTGNNVFIQNNRDTTRKGISLEGCKRVTVGCNDVNGSKYKDTLNDGNGTAKQIGICVSMSDHCAITCNSVDSTAWGFFFGGSNCLGTAFKGNDIYKHLHGLYLNSAAVIDTQSLAGNKWNLSNASFQAVNRNDSVVTNLKQSLFVTNPTVSGTTPTTQPAGGLYPNVYNLGWFDISSGTEYKCGGACTSMARSSGSSSLRQSIARELTLTSDFIPESKAISKANLFEELSDDASLIITDTVLSNFVVNNENMEIGKLFDIKSGLGDLGLKNNSNQINSLDSLIKFFADSISITDSLAQINPTTGLEILRHNLLNDINILMQSRNNILLQSNNDEKVLLQQLAIDNIDVTTSNDVFENEKIINGFAIEFEQNGVQVLKQNFTAIFSIASQCPYQGGSSVYRARALLEFISDTIEYTDAINCAQLGIFRNGSNQTQLTDMNDISIIPNPADENTLIELTGNYAGLCKLKLSDITGRQVFNIDFNCSEKSYLLNLKPYSNGLYFIEIKINDFILKTSKLEIIR